MNKLTSIITGILIFLPLFYNQDAGLNISIFALSIWIITYFAPGNKKADYTFWFLSATMLVSLMAWAWYGDVLSFFALLLSTLATAWYIQMPGLSFILYPFIFIINLLTLPFRIIFIAHWLPKPKNRFSLQKWVATILIPVFFLILFSFVYTTGSDVFDHFFSTIFRFNIGQVLALSILAFFILFIVRVVWVPRFLIRMNVSAKDEFKEETHSQMLPSFKFLEKGLELRSGQISLFLLNILLFIFIIAYNYEQFFTVSKQVELSTGIHDRVNTIIVSILMAIGLLLFYFRSKNEPGKSTVKLQFLAGVWVVLNSLLVVSAIIKNAEYISVFGLTFKRISVFIFLMLCLIGLAFSWVKIKLEKTNTFLINRMMWAFYLTIIITAPINFSWIVTRYNLAQPQDTDIHYLQRLNYNKKVLYDLYKDDPEWKKYWTDCDSYMDAEQKKSFLSGHLYYKLYWNDKIN